MIHVSARHLEIRLVMKLWNRYASCKRKVLLWTLIAWRLGLGDPAYLTSDRMLLALVDRRVCRINLASEPALAVGE